MFHVEPRVLFSITILLFLFSLTLLVLWYRLSILTLLEEAFLLWIVLCIFTDGTRGKESQPGFLRSTLSTLLTYRLAGKLLAIHYPSLLF